MGRGWAGVLGGVWARIPFGEWKRKGKGRGEEWEVDVEGVGRGCGPRGEEVVEGRLGGVRSAAGVGSGDQVGLGWGASGGARIGRG